MEIIIYLVLFIVAICLFLYILKNPTHGLYLAIFLMPILTNPFVALSWNTGFELTRQHYLSLVDVVVLMVFVSWLLQILTDKRKIISAHFGLYMVLLLFLVAMLTSIFSANLVWRGYSELIVYVYLFLFFFLITQLVSDEFILNKTIKAWLISCSFVIFFGIIQMIALKFGIRKYIFWFLPPEKITSVFMTPNQLVSYLGMSLPFLLFVGFKENVILKSALYFILIFSSIVVLLSTGSRTAVLLVIISFGLFFIWKIKYKRVWIISSLASFFILVLIMIPVFRNYIPTIWTIERALTIVRGTTIADPSGATKEQVSHSDNKLQAMDPMRFAFVGGWLKTVEESPVIGTGIGNFPSKFAEYFPEWGTATELHNTYLNVWAETGILGFGIFFIFLLMIFKKNILILFNKRFKDSYLRNFGIMLSISFAVLLFYAIFHVGLRQRHFWFLIAMIVVNYYFIDKNCNKQKICAE